MLYSCSFAAGAIFIPVIEKILTSMEKFVTLLSITVNSLHNAEKGGGCLCVKEFAVLEI